MNPRARADLVLVRRRLFESRKKAQDAIAAGLVTADGAVVRKASDAVALDAELSAAAPHPWVSRGGVKLEAALASFRFDPAGKTCLDIGASTGGFTDILVARGAARVYAVDVGRGQLHAKLAADPRVVLMEGINARDLVPAYFAPSPQLIVCDVSFISLRLILPAVVALSAATAELVCLVKPQFEAGRAHLAKGIVRSNAIHAAVCSDIEDNIRGLGWTMIATIPSPIAGGDGNREFLIGAVRQ